MSRLNVYTFDSICQFVTRDETNYNLIIACRRWREVVLKRVVQLIETREKLMNTRMFRTRPELVEQLILYPKWLPPQFIPKALRCASKYGHVDLVRLILKMTTQDEGHIGNCITIAMKRRNDMDTDPSRPYEYYQIYNRIIDALVSALKVNRVALSVYRGAVIDAIKYDNPPGLRLLLNDKRFEVNCAAVSYIDYAIERGYNNIVKELLTNRRSKSFIRLNDETVKRAIQRGNERIIESLVQSDYMKATNRDNTQVILKMMAESTDQFISYVLSNKQFCATADLNQIMSAAVAGGRTSIVKQLLRQYPDFSFVITRYAMICAKHQNDILEVLRKDKRFKRLR